MYQNGWALVRSDSNEEIESWLGTSYGVTPILPNVVFLPNGDHVHCPLPDTDYSGYQIVAKLSDDVAPPPQIISDRQFFQQLAVSGVITPDEALNAVGPGILPASLAALISQLPAGDGTPADPENQQFAANMLLRGATQFDRQHPLVATLANAFGWSSADADAFWRSAALL